jgi:hypothetical protein
MSPFAVLGVLFGHLFLRNEIVCDPWTVCVYVCGVCLYVCGCLWCVCGVCVYVCLWVCVCVCVCVGVCVYVCICVWCVFMLFIKHAPLQRSNTTCFIVHLCYIFVIEDAVTNTINGFPLQLPLLHTWYFEHLDT